MIEDGILKKTGIELEKIEYLGLMIEKGDIKKIQDFLDLHNISLIASIQPNMHITCHYFRGKRAINKNLLPDNVFLGQKFKIHISGYGELKNSDGVVLNQGLLVDKEELDKIKLADKRLTDFIDIEKPHITIAVNKQRVDGRPIAKAQDTCKCAFVSGIDQSKIDFDLTCKLAVVRFGQVYDYVVYDDYQK